jgi:hypothetical protein
MQSRGDVVGVADGLPGPVHLAGQAIVERVEGLGPIECDRGDVLVDLEGDGLELPCRAPHSGPLDR